MIQGEDGIDFINIYSKGKTKIGRELSNFSLYRIPTIYGVFYSIEGLIFYMGSHDEKLKTLYGFEAKKYGESVDKGFRLNEDKFRTIIVDAMNFKWKSLNYKMKKELIEGKYKDLPLVHFYEYGGKRIAVPKWDWQIKEWEKIRNNDKNKSHE